MKLTLLIICAFASCILCEQYACPVTLYNCRNGKCIHKYLVCDKKDDCSNGIDELGCDPSNVNVTVSPDTEGDSTGTSDSSVLPMDTDTGSNTTSASNSALPGAGTGNGTSNSSPPSTGTNNSEATESPPAGTGTGNGTSDSSPPSTGTENSDSTESPPAGTGTGNGTSDSSPPRTGTDSSTSDSTLSPGSVDNSSLLAVDLCQKMFPNTVDGVASQDHCQINCSGSNPMIGYVGRFSFNMNKDDLSSCTYDPTTEGVCFGGNCLRGQDVQACNVSTAGQLKLAEEVNSCQLTCWSEKGESYTRFADSGTSCTEEDDTSGYCDGYGNCDTHVKGKASNFTG